MNDTPENRQELDPNKLFEPPDACDYYVYDPRLKSLPFEQVSWQSFEKLSARLLEALFGSRFLQVFGYGRSGQAQYGIDIIDLKPGSVKQTVMQCKNVREVKRGQLHTWVKQFLANKKASDSDHYILCIPFAVNEDAKLVEEWAEQALLLDRHEINAELWGLDKLNELLREQASLVEIFFGEKIASGFCSRARIPDKYPARYRREFEAQYDNSVVLENETVRLDAFVPDEHAARLAATLSFARSDSVRPTYGLCSTMTSCVIFIGYLSGRGLLIFQPPNLSNRNGDFSVLIQFKIPSRRLSASLKSAANYGVLFSRSRKSMIAVKVNQFGTSLTGRQVF